MRPLIVVEGEAEAVADALADVRRKGWTVVSGWDVSGRAERTVCTGEVRSAADAAAALLAVVAGAGLVVAGRAERDVLDLLCDDLRRLGQLDHRTRSTPRPPTLTAEERTLADLLLAGITLGQAAQQLNISRRTADRRLASFREALGVETTAEALIVYGRLRP